MPSRPSADEEPGDKHGMQQIEESLPLRMVGIGTRGIHVLGRRSRYPGDKATAYQGIKTKALVVPFWGGASALLGYQRSFSARGLTKPTANCLLLSNKTWGR